MDAKIIYLEALAAGSGLAETDSPLEGAFWGVCLKWQRHYVFRR